MMETRAETAAARAEEEERERRDWFDMMRCEAAFRVWVRLLEDMGVGRLLVSEEDMRLRNIADQILDRMAAADPDIYLRVVRTLKRL